MINPSIQRRSVEICHFSWVVSCLLCFTGCGDTSSTDSAAIDAPPVNVAAAKSTRRDARSLLRMTFERYRNADIYHDRGEVELVYESQRSTEKRKAPLAVWYQRGELSVSAYSLRLWRDTGESLTWFVPPVSKTWDHQVAVGTSTGRRPDLDAMLDDPVVVTELAAGPAGPPPQLEWLFATDPMSKLFNENARFDFDSSQVIDGSDCVAIRVRQEDERFVFHIDRARSLIRRVDLPEVPLSLADGRTSAGVIRLTLQLRAASFQPKRERPGKPNFPSLPLRVRRFVPPPPVTPAWIDQSVRSLPATDAGGNRFDWRSGPKTPFTVCLVIDDEHQRVRSDQGSHARPELALLRAWSARIPDGLRNKFRVGAALAIEPSRRVTRATLVGLGENLDFAVRINSADANGLAPPGSLLITDRRGSIQWVQAGFGPEVLPGIGAILADLNSGIDVAERMREQRHADRQAYQQTIQAERASLADGQGHPDA